jgi:hypothetical protein
MSESSAPEECAAGGSDSQRRIDLSSRTDLWPWAVMGLILVWATIQLRLQGRVWWCACGGWSPWAGDTWSRHNSQHLLDPYSFSHVLHGLIFCGALAWLFPRVRVAWRLVAAALIETAWEVTENTEFVIDRYRTVTASLDYHGDSVINSLGDILCFVAGFWLARRLGLWRSVALFVVTELALLFFIRDNLTLNVLMLLWPIQAIKTWQIGG